MFPKGARAPQKRVLGVLEFRVWGFWSLGFGGFGV